MTGLFAVMGFLALFSAGICLVLIRMQSDLDDAKKQNAKLSEELTTLKRHLGVPTAVPDAVLQTLTDPARLDAELEKSANLTEMRRARRRTLPRLNAGPPAKVRAMRIHRNKI